MRAIWNLARVVDGLLRPWPRRVEDAALLEHEAGAVSARDQVTLATAPARTSRQPNRLDRNVLALQLVDQVVAAGLLLDQNPVRVEVGVRLDDLVAQIRERELLHHHVEQHGGDARGVVGHAPGPLIEALLGVVEQSPGGARAEVVLLLLLEGRVVNLDDLRELRHWSLGPSFRAPLWIHPRSP